MAHRRIWIWTILAAFVAIVVATLVFVASVPLSSDTLRERIVRSLSDRLSADVTLAELHWRLYPRLRADGTGLTVRQHGASQEYPPLISIKEFAVEADLMGLLRKRVAHVRLDGLDIEVPPDRGQRAEVDGQKAEVGGQRAEGQGQIEDGVTIDTLEANGARLVIIPAAKNKAPRVWSIHTLRMHTVGSGTAMPFEARLTNAVPPGEIDTSGTFGPWHRIDPAATPLEGAFTFNHADLSVFHGIAGVLSARGSFGGTMARIAVNGETETPDFTIKVGGHPFPLNAKYRAIVDGTRGDTILDRIDASFLGSSLVAAGSVIGGPPNAPGRVVALDITMDHGRIEDIMRMAVPTPSSPMVGGLKLTTKFVLPPGETDVAERLRLDGRFALNRARFMSYDVQGRIEELSHRSRGRKPEDSRDRVASDFQGRFKLGGGRLTLPDLTFAVPGTNVQLAGSYALKHETLDFKGTLYMDAKVSQTQTGFKSLLLKVVDPLFNKRGGGSAVPIRINGTRDKPDFGLDMGRVFHRGP